MKTKYKRKNKKYSTRKKGGLGTFGLPYSGYQSVQKNLFSHVTQFLYYYRQSVEY